MNNPFDYTPDIACEEAFRKLTARVDELKRSDNPDDINFCRELEAGKMLGVLIAADACGAHHELYAFSGQLGDRGFHYRGFVGPVFDYLQPYGHFKTKEADISRQNAVIASFEKEILSGTNLEYEAARKRMEEDVAEYKERCRLSKLKRKEQRKAGIADEARLAAMIRQSQFEKAELQRLKKRMAARLEPLAANLKNAQSCLDAMKERRRSDSEALQQWLFSNFILLNARGESRSLSDIFAETPMKTPPSYNRKNEMSIFQKRNEQIFSFFASFFLLLFRPLKHQLKADFKPLKQA